MKNVYKVIGLSVVASSLLCASGWRIPEQSAKSVALSGAYIANANGADATYYNPANMSFNKNKTEAEISLMTIGLTSIEYKDNQNLTSTGQRDSTYNGESKEEDFIIPTIFVSTKDYNNNGIRYGFSVTAPGGLSKRWDTTRQKTSAEEFTLKIVELNPTMSYKISKNFSIAGGLRILKSEGVVKSDGTAAKMADLSKVGLGNKIIGGTVTRDMEGDGLDYGYNLAASYKSNDVIVGLTYRSEVMLKEEGTAKLSNGAWKVAAGQTGAGTTIQAAQDTIQYDASVEVPLPAVLTLSYAHKINNTTIELTYDKTYWSAYENLDFEYDKALANSVLTGSFDDPKAKNWEDTVAWRIGLTHEYKNGLSVMLGYAKDENPAPEEHIGYELPDSDATLYSFGLDYELDKTSSIGFGYLYDEKESREVTNKTESGLTNIDGEFSNAKAHLVSVAYRSSF